MKYLLLFFISTTVNASLIEDINYQGNIGFSYRQFEVDQNKENFDQQLVMEGRFSVDYEGENYKTYISTFGRADAIDSSRNFLNIDEAYYKFLTGKWSLSLGNQIFNWSVLEIFHPVDSINARNLDSNAERIERLGQPAVTLTREFENSIIQFIALLKTISPIAPSPHNRNGPQVYLEDPQFVEGDLKYTNDPDMPEAVIHYLHNFEKFDLDLHFARKYDTANPVIGKTYPTVQKIQATPYYLPVTQLGIAVQGTHGEYIYKFEHIKYNFDNYKVCTFTNCINYYSSKQDHSLTAFGLEHTKVYKNDQEGTFFLEYQTVLGTTIEEARTLNAFQRDLGMGYRHNFNDFDGHEIIVILIEDVDRYHEQIFGFTHSFRLNASWKFKSEIRIVNAKEPSQELDLDNFSGLKPISESDNILFKLTKFF